VEIISVFAHVLIKSTQDHTDLQSWKQPFNDLVNVLHKLFCMSEDIYAFAADRGPVSFLRTSRCLWTNISGVEQCRRVDSQHEHGTQGLAVFVGTKHLHLCLHFSCYYCCLFFPCALRLPATTTSWELLVPPNTTCDCQHSLLNGCKRSYVLYFLSSRNSILFQAFLSGFFFFQLLLLAML
jgi:hypothetical protein